MMYSVVEMDTTTGSFLWPDNKPLLDKGAIKARTIINNLATINQANFCLGSAFPHTHGGEAILYYNPHLKLKECIKMFAGFFQNQFKGDEIAMVAFGYVGEAPVALVGVFSLTVNAEKTHFIKDNPHIVITRSTVTIPPDFEDQIIN